MVGYNSRGAFKSRMFQMQMNTFTTFERLGFGTESQEVDESARGQAYASLGQWVEVRKGLREVPSRREAEKGLNDTWASGIWALLGFGANQTRFSERLRRERRHFRAAPCEIEKPFSNRGLAAAAAAAAAAVGAALKQLIAASEKRIRVRSRDRSHLSWGRRIRVVNSEPCHLSRSH